MPRRPSSSNRKLLTSLLWVIGVGVFLLMGISPLIETMLPHHSSAALWLEWSRSRVMETMVAIWFFVFGSMVGSFINVVVWRMPRGVSVVSKGSACPWCTNKIRLADNIPIFGWIKLGGRCRVCRLPISPRYPIVETIFGGVFLLMFFVELQSTAANLPGGKRHLSTGILQVIISTKWDIILIYVYHMVLLVMLLIWSLMAFDRSRIPVKTVMFALVAGFAVSLAFPYVHPLSWSLSQEVWFADLPWIDRLATGFLGLVSGFFVGSFLEQCGDKASSRQDARGLAICFSTIGLFTGWQAVIWILLLFGIAMSVRCLVNPRGYLPASAMLTLATVVFLCTWIWFYPLPDSRIQVLQIGIAAVLGLLLVLISQLCMPVDAARVDDLDQTRIPSSQL